MPSTARHRALIIGAGSAGLSTSYFLKQHGVDHAVLERDRVGSAWARRWDSFTLVTPNQSVRLPGSPYTGPDPGGFMPRDEIVATLEAYARHFGLPVRTGVEVQAVRPREGGGWHVDSGGAPLEADTVVVATGAFPEPRVHTSARALSPRILQIHTSQYRNPRALPDGGVLIVGGGQSGVQIAEELLEAGRRVHMCVGKCPRVPRRYRGKEIYDWLIESGLLNERLDALESPAMRLACNLQVSGRDGGHSIDVWRLARRGVSLHGRLKAVDGETIEVADTLREALSASEDMSRRILDRFDEFIAKTGGQAPPADPAERDFSIPPQEGPARIDLKGLGVSTLVWATGFRPSYPWVGGCTFDADGFPVTRQGVTDSEGLYFVGLHFMHTRKSGLLAGVAEDAEHVAGHIADRMRRG